MAGFPRTKKITDTVYYIKTNIFDFSEMKEKLYNTF